MMKEIDWSKVNADDPRSGIEAVTGLIVEQAWVLRDSLTLVLRLEGNILMLIESLPVSRHPSEVILRVGVGPLNEGADLAYMNDTPPSKLATNLRGKTITGLEDNVLTIDEVFGVEFLPDSMGMVQRRVQ